MYLIVCVLQIPLEALLSVGSLQKYGAAEGRPLKRAGAMAKAQWGGVPSVHTTWRRDPGPRYAARKVALCPRAG